MIDAGYRCSTWKTGPQRLRIVMLVSALAAAVAVPPSSARAGAVVDAPAAPVAAGAGHGRAVVAAIALADRDRLLGRGWRRSTGRVWTLVGTAGGLHVLRADASDGYRWRSIAVLTEVGFDTDLWVGNGCLTRSGRRLVVSYAPKGFTNDPVAFDRAAFAAVVDLGTGRVRKLPTTTTLAYSNPGCGAGQTATLTQYDHDHGPVRTRLVTVDAASGRLGKPRVVPGELVSAMAVGDAVVAARGTRLVRIDAAGRVTVRASASGNLSRLRLTTGGTVLATETIGESAVVRSFGPGSRTGHVVASGPRTELKTHQGSHGRVFIAGAKTSTRALGAGVRSLPGAAGVQVGDDGELMIRGVTRTGASDGVLIDAVTRAGAPVRFAVPSLTAAAQPPGEASPALRLTPAGVTADADDPIDTAATCAVPRNDVRTQVYQPNPRQVEWAVDQAVKDNLKTARPANWKQSGLPSYAPQTMASFRLPALRGGGIIPPQILLGVLAQESNLWQASGHAIETWTGNPLIGNFYGRVDNGWSIDFSKADCGYGVGQITDGMRKGSTLWGGLDEQRAIAVDYTVNIAAAAKLLAEKWNQLWDAGLLVNGGNSARPESWFGAVWAYNSGLHPQGQDPSGAWGLGWTNNPMSGLWDPARKPFLDYSHYEDASHPQDWPYPEKVMGWAAYPLSNPRLGASYRAAWWSSTAQGESGEAKRTAVKPPLTAFCDYLANGCRPPVPPDTSNCSRADLKCWWHHPAAWKDCNDPTGDPCGHYLDRFDTTYAEPQPDGAHTPPDPERNLPACDRSGLPAGAEVIDDLPNGVASSRCGGSFTSAGSFSLRFGSAGSPPQYVSKIDFHQVGLGFMGHAWFTHSQATTPERDVTGVWQLGRSLDGWARVLVHMPDVAGDTQQARYVINLGNGLTKTRTLLQRTYANTWVSLGVFRFAGVPRVSLSSKTFDGDGTENVAWDAVAVQPLPGKPANVVVSLGDSYASGEGASDTDGRDYYRETNNHGRDTAGNRIDPHRNACHRSPFAWPRLGTLTGSSSPIGQRADSWDPALDHQLLACSGAQSENLLPSLTVPAGQTPPRNAFGEVGVGQYRDLSQLDRGFLDENTTLVTVSVGGNDARFSAIIQKCITLLTDVCQDSTLTGVGDSEPLKRAEPNVIAGPVEDSVVTTLQEIRKQAPAAKIMLMGYPALLERHGFCVLGIGEGEAPWLEDMGALLATHLSEAVERVGGAAAGFYFSDPRDEFRPNGPGSPGYGVCGEPQRIRGIVTTLTESDLPGLSSAQSFHPDKDGHIVYAQSFNETLRRMGL